MSLFFPFLYGWFEFRAMFYPTHIHIIIFTAWGNTSIFRCGSIKMFKNPSVCVSSLFIYLSHVRLPYLDVDIDLGEPFCPVFLVRSQSFVFHSVKDSVKATCFISFSFMVQVRPCMALGPPGECQSVPGQGSSASVIGRRIAKQTREKRAISIPRSPCL